MSTDRSFHPLLRSSRPRPRPMISFMTSDVPVGPLAHRIAERDVLMVEDATVDHGSGPHRLRLTQLFQRALLDDEALAVALRQLGRTGREMRDADAADELQRAAGVGWEADRENRAQVDFGLGAQH